MFYPAAFELSTILTSLQMLGTSKPLWALPTAALERPPSTKYFNELLRLGSDFLQQFP